MEKTLIVAAIASLILTAVLVKALIPLLKRLKY